MGARGCVVYALLAPSLGHLHADQSGEGSKVLQLRDNKMYYKSYSKSILMSTFFFVNSQVFFCVCMFEPSAFKVTMPLRKLPHNTYKYFIKHTMQGTKNESFCVGSFLRDLLFVQLQVMWLLLTTVVV